MFIGFKSVLDIGTLSLSYTHIPAVYDGLLYYIQGFFMLKDLTKKAVYRLVPITWDSPVSSTSVYS